MINNNLSVGLDFDVEIKAGEYMIQIGIDLYHILFVNSLCAEFFKTAESINDGLSVWRIDY